jgi:hypothetical protein
MLIFLAPEAPRLTLGELASGVLAFAKCEPQPCDAANRSGVRMRFAG